MWFLWTKSSLLCMKVYFKHFKILTPIWPPSDLYMGGVDSPKNLSKYFLTSWNYPKWHFSTFFTAVFNYLFNCLPIRIWQEKSKNDIDENIDTLPYGFFKPSSAFVRLAINYFGVLPVDRVISYRHMICDGRFVLLRHRSFAGWPCVVPWFILLNLFLVFR